MADQTLQLGIVGCGSATQIMYTPVLRHVERLQVTALCDPFQGSLDATQRLLGVPLEQFTDYDDFLRRAPVDAVIIATPVFLHHEQVLKAAKAGKHILCQKPMARTLAECDAMIAACADAGVTLTIGFMKRFDKSLRHAKALIEAGRLGVIDQLLVEWRGGMPSIGRANLNATRPADNWRPRLETLGVCRPPHPWRPSPESPRAFHRSPSLPPWDQPRCGRQQPGRAHAFSWILHCGSKAVSLAAAWCPTADARDQHGVGGAIRMPRPPAGDPGRARPWLCGEVIG